MRIVVLAPNPWSETSIATCAALAQAGQRPVGALSLRSMHWPTLVRKANEWGTGALVKYAFRKLTSREPAAVQNPYLLQWLSSGGTPLRSLAGAGARYGFPVRLVDNINSPESVTWIRERVIDLAVYTGGGIVRRALIEATRLGVLNSHAGPLPQVRGMSAPEWSLLKELPLCSTAHLMDVGVDTGPLLMAKQLPADECFESLDQLRHRLAALGIEIKLDAVRGLEDGTLEARPQQRTSDDLQYFVMHALLRRAAERRLLQRLC